jgi:pimeloyl-[acyl-carrier protein] methyl ester esterase
MNTKNNLFVRRTGKGAPLVLLHGWGFSTQIWASLIPELTPHFEITLIDLPGHGQSPPLEGHESIVDLLVQETPANAVWLGWSLGGLLSLMVEKKYPKHINELLLVASTPKFTTDAEWPYGVAPHILEQFAARLETSVEGTLTQFMALQTMGIPAGRQEAKKLAGFVKEHLPSLEGLRWGLDILKTQDLRESLNTLTCPTQILLGAKDALVPASLGDFISQQYPTIKTEVLSQSAHIPFLSHPSLFLEWLFKACNKIH